jgi:hypothetical protein
LSTETGDIVEIVLDVVHVSDDRGEHERVLVQGVFPRGSAHPPMPEGAQRNAVQVFFGRNMGGIRAFLIGTALTADGELRPPPPADESAGDGQDD